jgi:acyl-ACP thioesterase
LTEIIAPPGRGRTFTQDARPGLADCAPSGRIRLDAIARLLQDVAYADVEDAGLAASAVWVVRRNRIKIERFPRFADRLTLTTFCSGIGRAWAERQTTIHHQGSAAPDVEAVAVWVHLDPETWMPARVSDAEIEIYGDAAGDRKISARLRHEAAPPEDAESRPWTFRATECDVADHINNAAYWAPLEDELLSEDRAEPETFDGEIEFRSPAQPGPKRVLATERMRWIVSDAGETHASIRLPF